MKKLSFKKLFVRYQMTLGDKVLYISVSLENKVLIVFFGDESNFEKLISAVIDARGHFGDVTDDYKVIACGPDNRMYMLGNVKSLIV